MNADVRLDLFRRALPLQAKLRETVRVLGSPEGKVCLEVGFDDPVISRQLRRRGGTWHTLVRDAAVCAPLLEAVEENVGVWDGPNLPFDDKTFDVVILSDLLEHVPDDAAVVTECHRVLKPMGSLVVHVPHTKRWSAVPALQMLTGTGRDPAGRERPGYSEAQLFQLLKQGFDVHTVRSYARALEELVDRIARARAARQPGGGDEPLLKNYARLYPFHWIAFQLDSALFLTKGYRLVAVALRHPWRPRKAPILNDGRSISQVVLSRVRH